MQKVGYKVNNDDLYISVSTLLSVRRYAAIHSQFGLDVGKHTFYGIVHLRDMQLGILLKSPQPRHITF